MQPYLLSNNLGMAVSEEGRASSLLQVSYEIVVLLAVGPLGALADRIGRRPIYALGFAWISVSFMLFPLVENLTQLVLCRMFFGVGSACVTSMMATVLADYPLDRSRGMLLAASGIGNGIGAISMVLILSQLPGFFGGMGYDALESGRMTYWFGATLALISSVVVYRGLQAGVPGTPRDSQGVLSLLREGAGVARKNPRVLVACAEAFVARGDLVVISTYFSLWAIQTGRAGGLPHEEAIRTALMSNEIIRTLGGAVVQAPGSASIYDIGLVESDPGGSVEAALSAFDAQLTTSMFFNKNERPVNQTFPNLFRPTFVQSSRSGRGGCRGGSLHA